MKNFVTYMTESIRYTLDLRRQVTVDLAKRDVRCPNCHFLLLKVFPELKAGMFEIQCTKCRQLYVLDFQDYKTARNSMYVTLTPVTEKEPLRKQPKIV